MVFTAERHFPPLDGDRLIIERPFPPVNGGGVGGSIGSGGIGAGGRKMR
jgi:hypothetical protein